MKLIGEISEQVRGTIKQIQQQQDTLLHQIGKLEYQKASYLEDLKKLQGTTEKLLDQEAKGLGIPPGVEWQISSQDGRVYVKEVGEE